MEKRKFDMETFLSEEGYENSLGIDTFPKDDDAKNNSKINYNYGVTSYAVLNDFFRTHPFSKDDHLVDFGCGKGRVLVMAAYYGCPQITGYEINKDIFDVLIENIKIYKNKFNAKNIFNPINIDATYANIDITTNKFFFFNPFHLKLIIKTVNKILSSLNEKMRPIEIIFYYPENSTLKYFDTIEIFKKMEVLHKNHKKAENDHCYVIYRNIQC